MKKMLALFLALALILTLAACGAKAEPAPTEAPTEASTEAPTEAAAPLFYKYSEDRGDFKIEWTLLLNPDGTYLMDEVHGLSGETTSHSGKSWTDNGDGTITTGPWDVSADVSDFMEKDGSATWVIDGINATPVNAGAAEENESSVNPGQYTFVDGETTWLLKIMGNGSCILVEVNTASGEELKEHTVVLNPAGQGWTDNGDGTFETGEWEEAEREDNKPRMSAPNGMVTWKVVDPENKLVEPTEAAKKENEIAYGAYHYTDSEGGSWNILVMGNGNCAIQPAGSEGNGLKDDGGNPVEYMTNGFRVNDDGTFTSFPFQDTSLIPAFLADGEDGMATWRIVDAENMIVEEVAQ